MKTVTKKPKKIASANDRETTGFVTADKFLSDIDDIGVTRKDTKHHSPCINISRDRHNILSTPSSNPNQHEKPRDNLEEVQTSTNKYKQPRDKTPPPNPRLSILSHLKSGVRPSKICAKLGIPNSTMAYHLRILKDQGVICKVGYGVWEVLDQPETTKKRTAGSSYVGKKEPRSEPQKNLYEFIPDSVRGHAFTFRLKVPKNMQNWTNEKREQYLTKKKIPYITLGIRGGGQRVIINGRKTWLTNSSIVVYDTGSYFAGKPIKAKGKAIHNFLKVIKKVERELHTEFKIGNDYKFRVSRQHFALIKNALAQQYIHEGLKLEVRSEGDNSLWFLIDDSSIDGIRFQEAETVHPDTAMTDSDAMQNFFNSVKDTKATIHTLMEPISGILQIQAEAAAGQAAFAADLKTHVAVQKTTGEVLQMIADSVQDLTTAAQELTKAAKRGNAER